MNACSNLAYKIRCENPICFNFKQSDNQSKGILDFGQETIKYSKVSCTVSDISIMWDLFSEPHHLYFMI